MAFIRPNPFQPTYAQPVAPVSMPAPVNPQAMGMGWEIMLALQKMMQDNERYNAEFKLKERELGAQEETARVNQAIANANMKSIEDERLWKTVENASKQFSEVIERDTARIEGPETEQFQKDIERKMELGGQDITREFAGLSDLLDPALSRTREGNMLRSLETRLPPDMIERSLRVINKKLEAGDRAGAAGAFSRLQGLLSQAEVEAKDDERLRDTIGKMRESLYTSTKDFHYDPNEEVAAFQRKRFDEFETSTLEYQAGLNDAKLRGPEAVLQYQTDVASRRLRSRQRPQLGDMGPPSPPQQFTYTPPQVTQIGPERQGPSPTQVMEQIGIRKGPQAELAHGLWEGFKQSLSPSITGTGLPSSVESKVNVGLNKIIASKLNRKRMSREEKMASFEASRKQGQSQIAEQIGRAEAKAGRKLSESELNDLVDALLREYR